MMTAPNISRASVERAEPLEFPARKPARQDLTITITATLDGFPVELCYTGSIDQLLHVTKRLRELGAEPVSGAPTAAPPARKPAKRVQPAYNDAGDPCCPVHHKPLKDGKWGLYCPAKDDSTERGYCALKFIEA